MLAPVIIERYSKLSFSSFAASRIFAPLDMSATTYFVSAGEKAGTAAHAFTASGRRIPTCLTDAEVSLMAGAGGVVSSVADLTRWVAHLLGPGSPAIPRAVLDEVMGPQALIRGRLPQPSTYGLGWLQWVYHGHRVVVHGGAVDGVSTAIALFPDDRLGLIALANAEDQAVANQDVMLTIANVVFDIDATVDAAPASMANKGFGVQADVDVAVSSCVYALSTPRMR